MIIKKMFRTFDSLYHSKIEAEKSLIGWEHKEALKEYYVLASPYDLDSDIVDIKVKLFIFKKRNKVLDF